MDLDKYLETFINNVKDRLGDDERSDAWLARKSDLTPASISRLFKKERSPNFETIVSIAKALGCEPAELLIKKQSPAETGLRGDLNRLIASLPESALPDAIHRIEILLAGLQNDKSSPGRAKE